MAVSTSYTSKFKSTLKQIDDVLQCGICYEYLNTAVITNCSHNYCSLCIRTYLNCKTSCPACFCETVDSDLRPNRALDNMILLFTVLKNEIPTGSEEIPGDNNADFDCFETLCKIPLPSSTPSKSSPLINTTLRKVSSVFSQSGGYESSCSQQVTPSKTLEASQPSSVTPKKNSKNANLLQYFSPNKISSTPSFSFSQPVRQKQSTLSFGNKGEKSSIINKVDTSSTKKECPICCKEFPTSLIARHADECLKRTYEPTKPKASRNPLPKRVYSIMKDGEIKAELRKFGLPVNGDRKAITNRHKKFVEMYNSEQDKEDPRNSTVLVKDFIREEKTKPAASQAAVFKYNSKSAPEVIEKERVNIAKKYKGDFSSLLEDLKKRNKRPVKKSPVKKSPVKKSPVKKSPVKKSPMKKSPMKKSPMKKSPVKKSPMKKSPNKAKPPKADEDEISDDTEGMMIISQCVSSKFSSQPKLISIVNESYSEIFGDSPEKMEVSQRTSKLSLSSSKANTSLNESNDEMEYSDRKLVKPIFNLDQPSTSGTTQTGDSSASSRTLSTKDIETTNHASAVAIEEEVQSDDLFSDDGDVDPALLVDVIIKAEEEYEKSILATPKDNSKNPSEVRKSNNTTLFKNGEPSSTTEFNFNEPYDSDICDDDIVAAFQSDEKDETKKKISSKSVITKQVDDFMNDSDDDFTLDFEEPFSNRKVSDSDSDELEATQFFNVSPISSKTISKSSKSSNAKNIESNEELEATQIFNEEELPLNVNSKALKRGKMISSDSEDLEPTQIFNETLNRSKDKSRIRKKAKCNISDSDEDLEQTQVFIETENCSKNDSRMREKAIINISDSDEDLEQTQVFIETENCSKNDSRMREKPIINISDSDEDLEQTQVFNEIEIKSKNSLTSSTMNVDKATKAPSDREELSDQDSVSTEIFEEEDDSSNNHSFSLMNDREAQIKEMVESISSQSTSTSLARTASTNGSSSSRANNNRNGCDLKSKSISVTDSYSDTTESFAGSDTEDESIPSSQKNLISPMKFGIRTSCPTKRRISNERIPSFQSSQSSSCSETVVWDDSIKSTKRESDRVKNRRKSFQLDELSTDSSQSQSSSVQCRRNPLNRVLSDTESDASEVQMKRLPGQVNVYSITTQDLLDVENDFSGFVDFDYKTLSKTGKSPVIQSRRAATNQAGKKQQSVSNCNGLAASNPKTTVRRSNRKENSAPVSKQAKDTLQQLDSLIGPETQDLIDGEELNVSVYCPNSEDIETMESEEERPLKKKSINGHCRKRKLVNGCQEEDLIDDDSDGGVNLRRSTRRRKC